MNDQSEAKSMPGSPVTIRPDAAVKRDASAAKRLPELYTKLGVAADVLSRAKSSDLNVFSVDMHIGGDQVAHTVSDKKAFADLVVKDLEKTVSDIKAEIKALGFDAD